MLASTSIVVCRRLRKVGGFRIEFVLAGKKKDAVPYKDLDEHAMRDKGACSLG